MADLGTVASRPPTSPLAYSNFRNVWTGQFVSQIGSSAQAIGVSFFLREVTQSGSWVGGAVFLSGLGALIFLPLAGVVADRHNRRSIVLACDTLNAGATLGLVSVFLLAPGLSVLHLAIAVVICNIIIAISSAFFRPAFGAMLPDLVPRGSLAPANALYKAGARVGDLLGNTCGGFVYRAIGPGALFLANAISYVLSILFVLRAKPGCRFSPTRESSAEGLRLKEVLREFSEGVWVLTRAPGGALFLSMALVVNFFVTPFFVLMPFHVSRVLHGGALFYGLLMATLSAGVLAGYLAAAKFPLSRATRPSSVVCVIVCMCGCFLLFSLLRNPYFAFITLFMAGLANGYWSIFFETAIQSVIPRESLGRVYACYGLLSGGLIPLASLAGGVVLDVLSQDTRMLFSLCASIMTTYPLVLLSNRRFVSFFEYLKRVSREA